MKKTMYVSAFLVCVVAAVPPHARRLVLIICFRHGLVFGYLRTPRPFLDFLADVSGLPIEVPLLTIVTNRKRIR